VAERVDGEVALTLSPRADSSDIRFHPSVKSQKCRPMAAAGGVGGLIVLLYDECAASGWLMKNPQLLNTSFTSFSTN